MRHLWFAWVLLGVGCGDSTSAVSDSNSAGGSTGTGGCMIGFEGCPCSGEGLCLAGLACVEGVCGGDGAPTGGLTGSDSASASAGSAATMTMGTMADDGTASASTMTQAGETDPSVGGTTEQTAASMSGSETSGTTAGVGNDTSSEGSDSNSGESSSTGGAGVCGDGTAEGDEACDGADLGGKTCDDFGFQFGALKCAPGCAHDTSACTNNAACGDGIVVPGVLCYAPISEITKYTSYRGIALADLNEDGHLDFVAVRSYANSVVVWPGVGDGTFNMNAAVTNLGLSLDPVRVVDINGDGHLDAIGTAGNFADIQVALGDGTGKLTAQAMYDSGIGTLFDVGDVDDDGRLDLTFCGKLSGKSVGFRRGLAGGNFGPMITYPVDPTYGASQCGFVDLDRDGNLDIWIARGTGNGSVFQVLYGNGAAQFTLDPMTIGISGDHWVWAGNLGEDDYVDILGLREQPNNGFLQVRHGTPTWLEDMLYNFEVEGWTQITGFLGNFDGNEIPDVLTRSGSHDVLEIFRGDGTGLFFDGVTVVGDVAISDVAVGDLNEDGLDDMLTVRAYEDGSSLSKVQVVLSNP
jgi:hypothetical protein